MHGLLVSLGSVAAILAIGGAVAYMLGWFPCKKRVRDSLCTE